MSEMNWDPARRNFVKLVGSGIAAIYLGGCATLWGKREQEYSEFKSFLENQGPFQRNLPIPAPRVFSGDSPRRPHAVLWNKKKWMKENGANLPAPSETVEVAIVGGGMSGILSAYWMKDLKPVLFEQNSRLGGNSRSESWQGLDYPIGAQYFDVPEPDSAIESFLQELGIRDQIRTTSTVDPIYLGGKRYENFWQTGTVPGSLEQFQKVYHHLQDMYQNKSKEFLPLMPYDEPRMRQRVEELDRISFKNYLENVVGGPLHPHLEEIIEYYFWSAAAASYSEISATLGLQFYGADFDQVAVPPGGMAFVLEAVLKKLIQHQDLKSVEQRFRTSSLVFDVRVEKDSVLISYFDAQDQLKTLRAKRVIMACPKFIAGVLMDQLEPERRAVIESLKYRSYLVANVLLREALPDSFYDLYFMNGRKEDTQESKNGHRIQTSKTTDFVNSSYARQSPQGSVITLSRGLPYEGARKELNTPGIYEKVRAEFEKDIYDSVLPILGMSRDKLVDLRIARWGHPMPISEVGTISKGKVDWLRKPFREKVFFVQQDNWMIPSFESVFHEALKWTNVMRAGSSFSSSGV